MVLVSSDSWPGFVVASPSENACFILDSPTDAHRRRTDFCSSIAYPHLRKIGATVSEETLQHTFVVDRGPDRETLNTRLPAKDKCTDAAMPDRFSSFFGEGRMHKGIDI